MISMYSKNSFDRKHTNALYIILSIALTSSSLYFFKITVVPIRNLIPPKNITICYHSLRINESNTSQISPYYRHATSARNSSYPFISGDTFRAFSDYIFDETRQDNLSSVKYGDMVFVKNDMLLEFFNSSFNCIQKPFVLVTHNSDDPAPGTCEAHLLNPKILIWYGSNPSVKNHPKLLPIPIGLANTRWPGGNIDKLKYAFKTHRKSWSQRTNLLYVNFNISTNTAEREKALSQALLIEDVTIVKKRISFETYLEQIGNVKYVLSPPGNGLDCHRTWEAIFMGAVPIVLTSGLDPLFSKIRSVIVNDWSDLTEQYLLSFNFSTNDEHILPNVLNAQYWHQTLLQYRNS